MSVERSIICDNCSAIIAAGSTTALARVDARQVGAVRIAGRDYCPSCAPDFVVLRP